MATDWSSVAVAGASRCWMQRLCCVLGTWSLRSEIRHMAIRTRARGWWRRLWRGLQKCLRIGSGPVGSSTRLYCSVHTGNATTTFFSGGDAYMWALESRYVDVLSDSYGREDDRPSLKLNVVGRTIREASFITNIFSTLKSTLYWGCRCSIDAFLLVCRLTR
jgi:hypothetical protein